MADAGDWLKRMQAEIEREEREKRERDGREPSEPPTTSVPPLPFVDMSNWDNEPVPQQDWAVLNRIPLRQSVLFSGEGGAGKSIETLHLCSAHTLARDWIGSMPEHGPAIFIDAEDEQQVIHYRLAAIADHYNIRFADLIKGGLHLISLVGQDALLATVSRSGKVEPTPLYKQVLAAAADIKPKMIGIASVSNVFAGDENNRNQVQQFVGLMTRVAIVANGSVVLISHPSLTGINTDTGLSGTTQWHNAVRARFYLRGVKPASGEQPDDDLREIVFKKNQYGPKAETITLRYERGLFLPVGGTGALDKLATEAKANELFVSLLAKFNKRNEKISSKIGAHMFAPAVFAKEPEAKAAHLKMKDFEDAMGRLFDANKIHLEQYGAPCRETFKLVTGGQS